MSRDSKIPSIPETLHTLAWYAMHRGKTFRNVARAPRIRLSLDQICGLQLLPAAEPALFFMALSCPCALDPALPAPFGPGGEQLLHELQRVVQTEARPDGVALRQPGESCPPWGARGAHSDAWDGDYCHPDSV